MANKEHLDLLRRDVDAWNQWRSEHPRMKPDLAGADLGRCDLMVANLAAAVLANANLVLANLRGADLRRADLTGANLVGARLLGVDLLHANLSGADLSTAEDLTQEQIEHTAGDERTNLPDDLRRPSRWLHPAAYAEVSRIYDQLQRCFHGPSWHGPSVCEALSGLTAAEAGRCVLRGTHTVWEIVFHLAAWEDVAKGHLRHYATEGLPNEEDWPEPPEATEEAWRETLDVLERGHRELEDEVRKLSDDRLAHAVAGDKRYTLYTLLHGVVQHNLYHAGQIALLKSALRGTASAAG